MSKKTVKLICLLAALFCLVSCSRVDNGGTVDESAPAESFAPSGEINMAFVQNDTLSPYEAKTKLNLELGRLMYDGLVKLGNGFEPSYVLASDISLDGTACVVTINPAAKFTDGNAVTADDVVYSVSAAKAASQSKYSSKLENVSSCTARDAMTVVFNLGHTDEYFIRLLDFPIFEKETEKQVNSDNKSVPPIGTGRYVFGQQNDKFYLEANQNWIGGQVNIAKINLVNLPDDDAVNHGTAVGSVDIYYSDLSSNDIPTMKGTSLSVTLSNLVYLGVNTSSGILSDGDLRRAVSAAIDREDIKNSVYFGYAEPAKGLFHSDISELSGLQTIDTKRDTDKAQGYLKSAGYEKNQITGLATNGKEKTIKLSLVYYSENSARRLLATKISEHLKSVGIETELKGLSWDEYISAIRYHSYDLYIAEIKIPDNLDAYSLATAGGIIELKNGTAVSETSSADSAQGSDQGGSGDSSGSATDGSGQSAGNSDGTSADADTAGNDRSGEYVSLEKALYKLHSGNGSVAEVLSCLNEQMSLIPICHRKGLVIYSDKISEGLSPTAGDPFAGLENCTDLSK